MTGIVGYDREIESAVLTATTIFTHTQRVPCETSVEMLCAGLVIRVWTLLVEGPRKGAG